MSARDLVDSNAIYGYDAAILMVHVLKQCGNDLSRANILKQATSIDGLDLPMLLPGIKINTSPTNYSPIRQMQLQSFNGKSWELFGDILQG
jgi:branched-chain amino acid transport system substrate-binding protein